VKVGFVVRRSLSLNQVVRVLVDEDFLRTLQEARSYLVFADGEEYNVVLECYTDVDCAEVWYDKSSVEEIFCRNGEGSLVKVDGFGNKVVRDDGTVWFDGGLFVLELNEVA
jgi:hypothetical protein